MRSRNWFRPPTRLACNWIPKHKQVPVQLSRNWRPAQVEGLPAVFTGGWVGYAGYDTVRYVYGGESP